MPRILFAGGLNENQNPNILEAQTGYNFELGFSRTKFIPRVGFSLSGTATNGSSINGFMQLVKRDNSETTLVCAGTQVYKWDGSTFTSVGSVTSGSLLRDTYWSLGDYLVITDITKTTVVKQWDGTTFGTLTTGLGATNLFARYGIVHRGRVWLFNVKTATDTPHLMVASQFETPTSYDIAKRAKDATFTTGNEAFYMLTPDLKPINGVAVFHDQLVISTEDGRLFVLTGSDSKDYAWKDFYTGSAAVGTESIANIGNDLVYMRKGGNIESFMATQQFGDVRSDDISRWIPQTVANLTGALIVYDQSNQKVFFFVNNGKVLVLFKDLLGNQLSPWTVYQTQHPSNFVTSAAKYMRFPGTSSYTVFFGDASGRIFDMNGEAFGDAGTYDIATLRELRLVDIQDQMDYRRKILNGRVTYRRIGDCELTLFFDWPDEYNVSESVIQLKGPPAGDVAAYYSSSSYYNDIAYYNLGSAFANKISSRGFSPTGRSYGVTMGMQLNTKVNFQIDYIDL
jgi:hypothetical protein